MNNVLLTRGPVGWETPDWLFAAIQREFNLSIDVCAESHTAKLPRFWTVADDALSRTWRGERCWMNPPYGTQIRQWVKKAAEEGANGALVVGLLPARTETRWWFDYVLQARLIRFLKGRLVFGGATNPAPFPNVIVVWEGRRTDRMPFVQWQDMRAGQRKRGEG